MRINLFSGAVAQFRAERETKPPIEQYIQAVDTDKSEDGKGVVEVVVTMHPELAKYIHQSRFSVHDTTYKRVDGGHNEWEVVIWNERLKRRESRKPAHPYFHSLIHHYLSRCYGCSIILQS